MTTHKHQSISSSASDSGFTLLESLMAIVILTIMLVGVAPFIVLATATRVQARRVEMATQYRKSLYRWSQNRRYSSSKCDR
uniref:Prepilin-type N-terminal cleavage/methylation domain-containing protein n=1 Tax=Desertifilum tharense IPPAS B-1220 TaxID=1781255 RepID=A0ACD5GZB7_9CYAN